jgi:hypothetical protein
MDKMKIKLPKKTDHPQNIELDGAKFSLKLDPPMLYSAIRPIIATNKDDQGVIGNPLQASYSLSRVHSVDITNATPPAMVRAFHFLCNLL